MTKEEFSNLKPTTKHKYVAKLWGSESWIVNNDRFCGKILKFAKGYCLSYHYHKLKDEVFYVLKGHVLLIYGMDDEISNAQRVNLAEGDSFYIPVGLRHRILAIKESEIIEFSSHHEDSDSYRIEIGH